MLFYIWLRKGISAQVTLTEGREPVSQVPGASVGDGVIYSVRSAAVLVWGGEGSEELCKSVG